MMFDGGYDFETLADPLWVRGITRAGDSGGIALNPKGQVVGVIEGGGGPYTILTPAKYVARSW